jgi:Tfp pilus assembly protein PilO
MLDNPNKFVLSVVLTVVLLAIILIGIIEYSFYLKRERDYNYQQRSCEAFKRENPSEKVFYGREVGCRVKRGDWWYSL